MTSLCDAVKDLFKSKIENTVKLVNSDQPSDPKIVAVVERW
jgi:hypothetical protein